MKISRKKLKNLIENFLQEAPDGLFPDSSMNVGADAQARYQQNQKSKMPRYDVDTKEKQVGKYKIPTLQATAQTKYKSVKDAFENGHEDFTIPELCLMWYQNVGNGKDLIMFGDGGVFNNHPDAAEFKKATAKILKNQFKKYSFNIIHPEERRIMNATTISKDNYYGKVRYSSLNIMRVLGQIVSGVETMVDMDDHFMVTVGSAGISGGVLVMSPFRYEELILHPMHKDSFRPGGTVKFKNRYDFTRFGPLADQVGMSSEKTSGLIPHYEPVQKPFDLIIEIDGVSDIPLSKNAKMSQSALDKGAKNYIKAEKENMKVGEKMINIKTK